MNSFLEEYTKLNEEQKKAVDTIEGPVLVVAGPGTGKTQLLSMRVANILRQTDVDPTNILCLTFTNKASINMRERLLELTNGEASNVMIKTFHGFSAELMNAYPDGFWNGARLMTAPDIVQDDIIQSILFKLPLSDPLALKFAGKYTALSDIKTALRLTKEAGLTPDKLKAIINANLAYIDIIEPQLIDILSVTLNRKRLPDLLKAIEDLPSQGIERSLLPLQSLSDVLQESLRFAISKDEPTNKTTHTGKWKQGVIQTYDGKKGMFKERERNNWWLSLANVYQLYRQELHKKGFYDYSDMLVEVIAVLEQNSELRADVQEQFQYVLIDEFQDSNSAQMRLAHLVADHESNLGKPNIMAVGDDDQSIYKFNGAELANMLTFKKNYPEASIIVLTSNYRSSQQILDLSSKIISQASDRLTLRDPSIKKNLIAKNEPKTEGIATHNIYIDQDHQFYDVCRQIQQNYLIKSSGQSMAVLARNNESLRRISAQLLDLEIPLSFHEQNNILDHPIINTTFLIAELLIALRQADTEKVNSLLPPILSHPMWEIKARDLWDFAINNRYKNWLTSLLELPPDNKLYNIAKWLNWLSSISSLEPLRIIFEYILGLRAGQFLSSPLKQWYSNETEMTTEYIRGLSALRLLLSLMDDFSEFSSGKIEDFVAYIQSAHQTGQIIADDTALINDSSAVELLTIHKAKGLEFDIVYIIDAIDNNWRPSTKGRKPPLNLPLQPAYDDVDDYIRLMYVASTRARHSIIISSFKTDSKGNEILPTPIIKDIFQEQIIQKPDNITAIKILENSISWPSLSLNDEKSMLKPQLENYKLSASALIDFLDVSRGGPKNFKERHFLRLPSMTTASMAFGNSMHSALEYAQILVNKDALDTTKVLKRYAETLSKQNLLSSESQRYLIHGQELLQRLLSSDTFWLPKGAMPEQSINDVILGQAQLQGKLDRIFIKDTTITVTDYKTGSPLPSLFTKDQNLAIKAWRQRTQLNFYFLLIKHSGRFKNYKTIKGQMIYLEASTPKQLIRELSASEEEQNKLARLIQLVWRKINALDFPDTNQYENTYQGIQKFENDILNC